MNANIFGFVNCASHVDLKVKCYFNRYKRIKRHIFHRLMIFTFNKNLLYISLFEAIAKIFQFSGKHIINPVSATKFL